LPRLAGAAGHGSIRRAVTVETLDAGRLPLHATAAPDPTAIGVASARRTTHFHTGILPAAAVLTAPARSNGLVRASAAASVVIFFPSSSVRGPPFAL
jgi:hypothetical protein